jgi:hypothetical protein
MPAGMIARTGALAQLGEHLLCKQRVVGSIPTGSTRNIALLLAACAARHFALSLSTGQRHRGSATNSSWVGSSGG